RHAGKPEMFNPLAGDGRLTPDGRHLALMNSPYKTNDEWIIKLAVVGTESGALEASTELRGQSTYNFLTFAPDGRTLFLEQYGEGATRTRGFDVASGKLFDLAGDGLVTTGFRTAAVLSPDGRTMYRFDAGRQTTNCTSTDGPTCVPNAVPPSVVALDLIGRRATILRLPNAQQSDDFEKYMLWSLTMTPDGATLYAANPALGADHGRARARRPPGGDRPRRLPGRGREALSGRRRDALARRADPVCGGARWRRGHRHGDAHLARDLAEGAPVRHPPAHYGWPAPLRDGQHGREARDRRHGVRSVARRHQAAIRPRDPAHRRRPLAFPRGRRRR